MVYVDSHTHLYDMRKGYALPPDIYPVIVGYSHGSNRKAVDTAKAGGFPFALGIAPQTTIKNGTAQLEEWVDFIRASRPNAIGEVGLDYKWAQNSAQVEGEKLVFGRMVALAKEMNLPLVIHSRDKPDTNNENGVPNDAVGDILGMISGTRFLMHFYSGTAEQAARIVGMGGMISVAHMRSKERRKVINTVPLDRLLIESDSPYVGMAPETVRDAAAYIAEVKGIGAGEVADATARNAMGFFNFRL